VKVLCVKVTQQFPSLAIDFQDDLSQNCTSATPEHSLSPW
jgi:hypothetical protein